MVEPTFLQLLVIFTLTILYGFAFIEILFVAYKIFYKEEPKPSSKLIYVIFSISLLLIAVSYVASTPSLIDLNFNLFFASLGLFFASITLFALGLIVRKIWEDRIKEMNIKLLSIYSIWIIQGIYLTAVIVCFLLALVSLIKYIQTIIP
jgi:hypothetical protein